MPPRCSRHGACRLHSRLADEPTGAVDSQTADELVAVLRRLNRQEGVTFAVLTHDRGLATRRTAWPWRQASDQAQSTGHEGPGIRSFSYATTAWSYPVKWIQHEATRRTKLHEG